MLQFYSLAFLVFLVVSLVGYYLVGRAFGRGQWIVLLVASMAFYALSGWQNFVFIGTTALWRVCVRGMAALLRRKGAEHA